MSLDNEFMLGKSEIEARIQILSNLLLQYPNGWTEIQFINPERSALAISIGDFDIAINAWSLCDYHDGPRRFFLIRSLTGVMVQIKWVDIEGIYKFTPESVNNIIKNFQNGLL